MFAALKRKIAIFLVVAALCGGSGFLTDWWATRRYERKASELERKAEAAEQRSAEALTVADALKAEAVALTSQLGEAETRLGNARGRQAALTSQVDKMKGEYEASKAAPVELSGDVILDRILVCAKLDASGHPCNP